MTLKRVAILGGGNMGEAIAKGIRDSRGAFAIEPGQTVIAEPDASKHTRLGAGNHGVVVASARDAVGVLAPDGIIIVAIKPQVFPKMAEEIRGMVGHRLVLTIMAGRTAIQVHEALGRQCRVVRAMPNLPLIEGDGMTAICSGPGALGSDVELCKSLFATLGDCIQLDESLMDAFTAVAGSGPAYVAYLAEAMVKGALAVGFDQAQSWRIVQQTIWGAARLLSDELKGPETVRAKVTSPGGTTAAATALLDLARVQASVTQAIVAARDRGRELAAS